MKKLSRIFLISASFKRQIVLTFVVGFFILSAAFVAYQVQFESDFLYDDSNDRTTALARSLAISSRSWVLADDVVGLQEVVNSVRDYPGLRYAMVVSPSGRVLAHTDASKTGQFVTDAQSRSLVGARPANRVMSNEPSFIDIAVPIVVNERLVGWARIGQERDFVTASLNRMIWRSAIFILVATALALLAAFLIARRLGYRIGSLVQVAEQVQAGNLYTRANIAERPDEISKLADSFNRMLDAQTQSQKELRDASRYTRSLIEASLDPLVTISAEGKINDVNQATEAVTGRNRAELIGTDFSDYFTEPHKASEGYQQVFQKGFITDYPLAIQHKDGHITHVLYNASVYRNESGEVLGVFAAARDITGRKLTEEALRENERFLDAIVEHVPNMLFVKDAKELRFVRFNKAGEQLLGYSRLDLIGKNDYDFFPKEQADFFVSKDRAIIASGKLMDIAEEPISTRLSGQRFLHTRKLPIYADDGSPRYLLGISEDITEHKLEEERLRRSEHSLSEAQRIAHLGNWELDLESNLLTWSDEIYRIFEIDPEKFGASYDAFLEAIHPEDRDMVNKAYTDSLASKMPYDIVHRLLLKDGRIKYVNEKCETHYGEGGKPLRSVGTVHDITELKEAEDKINELNRDLEHRVEERTAQLEVANKELEAFSYSVSHDLRTPLRAIDGFSRILLDEYRDKLDEEGKRLLGVVRSNTNRMGQLIDDILKFSRTGRVDMNVVEVDMEQQVRGVIAELLPADDNGKLQLEIEHLPPAKCDGALMHQVFVNLLSNAIKFSHKKEAPRIKIGSYSEGNEAIYYVKDNGAGFDMQYADKLFGVFQRLHSMDEFEGTGIGLAIVKRIITRHGGRVWAEGKVNEGATIYFALPI